MKKNTIRLNEAQLRKIVAENVKGVLKEGYLDEEYIGDDLQVIKNAVESIKEKISRGNIAGIGDNPMNGRLLNEKISEIDEIVTQLLSEDNWY